MRNQKLDITEMEETRNLHKWYMIKEYHKLRFVAAKNWFDIFQMQIRCKIHKEQAYVKILLAEKIWN